MFAAVFVGPECLVPHVSRLFTGGLTGLRGELTPAISHELVWLALVAEGFAPDLEEEDVAVFASAVASALSYCLSMCFLWCGLGHGVSPFLSKNAKKTSVVEASWFSAQLALLTTDQHKEIPQRKGGFSLISLIVVTMCWP